MFICSFITAPKQKGPKCPKTNEQFLNCDNGTSIHGLLLSNKKGENHWYIQAGWHYEWGGKNLNYP